MRGELRIVICAPVAPFAGKTFDPSAQTYSCYAPVPCPRCRQMMWLGSRSWIEVQNRRAKMLCMPCALQTGVWKPGQNLNKLTDADP